MSIFRYRVEGTRRVRCPEYGPHAYTRDTKSTEIPFGKGTAFKTGKEAYAEALSLARSWMPDSSDVSVARMHGGAGVLEYLKHSDETFDTPWA